MLGISARRQLFLRIIVHIHQIWEPFRRFLQCLHQITPLQLMRLANFFDDTRDYFLSSVFNQTPRYLAYLVLFLAEGNLRFCFLAFCTVSLSTLTNCLTYSVGMLFVAFGIERKWYGWILLVGATSSHHSFSYFCWDAWRCYSFSCVFMILMIVNGWSLVDAPA